MRLAKVYDWAAEPGFVPRGFNPARFKIEHHLVVAKHKVIPRKALPWKDAPAFMRDIRALGIGAGNEGMAASALELQILTGTRPSEARGAQWEEFDEDAEIWTVPGERMKKGEPLRVPLSVQALAIFRRMKKYRAATKFVFHSHTGNRLGKKYVLALCKNRGIHAHGFRSTFDDWSADHELSFELTEISLAHKFGSKVSRDYRRTDLLAPRRVLMQQWFSGRRRAMTTPEIRAMLERHLAESRSPEDPHGLSY